MANSVIQSQVNIFSFLSLPLELRWMIYMYALFTPFGLWLDTHRRDIPRLLRRQAIGPAPFDRWAAGGRHGIVSPALLLVCKQIYYEARHYLGCNQWRLNRWGTDSIANIPQSVRDKVASLFLGRDSAGLFAPPGTGSQNNSFFQLVMRLPNIQHLTVGMMEDDKGLSGTPSPRVIVKFADEKNLYGAMSWLYYYRPLFERGSIKSISLECIKTYPSNLYPWVYMWSWVTTMTLHMLELLETPEKYEEVKNLLDEVNLLLGCFERSCVPTYRNYAPLLESGHESAARFRTLSCLLKEVWEGFGIRVSARDPGPFERGTMIVIERFSAGDGASDRLSVAGGC